MRAETIDLELDERATSRAPISILHVASGCFVVLWLSVGAASFIATSFPAPVKLGILGLWVSLAILRSRLFLASLLPVGMLLLAVLIVVELFSTEILRSGQYSQGFAYLLIAIALMRFYGGRLRTRERNIVAGVMVGDLLITLARTMIRLQEDPVLSRYLATTEENRRAVYGDLDFSGLAGYGHAYALVGLLLIVLYFALNGVRRRLTLTVIFLLGVVIVIQLSFAIALVLLMVFSLALVIQYRFSIPLRIFSAALVLIALASGLVAWLLDAFAAQVWVSRDVRVRLLELSDLISAGSFGGDLGTRQELWIKSVMLFVDGGPLGIAGSPGPQKVSGGHSEWLDLLADYGLLALLVPIALVLVYRQTTASMTPPAAKAVGWCWAYILILGIFNTFLYATFVVHWIFLAPALAQWLHERVDAVNVAEVRGLR